MRLGWYSNAPWTPSGYGVQTALMTSRLKRMGHEMGIFANYGLEGAMMSWGDIPVFPKGTDATSTGIIASHAEVHEADAVVTLYDAWEFDKVKFGVPWCAYFPLDMEPMYPKLATPLTFAAVRVAMSEWGQKQTQDADMSCEYVPHCFEPEVYHPDASGAAKAVSYLEAEDRFIVGVVAANKGIAGAPNRKSFAQIIEGYGEFYKKHPDALLYLHSFSYEGYGGPNLQGLCDRYELPEDSYRIAPPYKMVVGEPVEKMRGLFSAMDVLLSPSMGEGFGVPIMEAQACGTPVIVGGWTAMPEVAKTGFCIPKEDAFEYYWPEYSSQWIPKPAAITSALEVAYQAGKPTLEERADIASQVSCYHADHVVSTYWPPVLEKLQAAVDEAKTVPKVKLTRKGRDEAWKLKQREKAVL